MTSKPADNEKKKFTFDPTISLGNIFTAITITGSVMLAWGSLQSTLAVHSTEIRQLQGVAAKYDSERAQDRADLKELIRDVKSDVKDVKNSIDIIKAGQK